MSTLPYTRYLPTVETLAPEPKDGHTIATVADVYSEILRLEEWWERIDEAPDGLPDDARENLLCEVNEWTSARLKFGQRVFAAISAGVVDPIGASNAVLEMAP